MTKQYPTKQYLSEVHCNREFAESVPTEIVIVMARQLLAGLEQGPVTWRYRYVKKGVTDSQGEPWVGDWKYMPTKEDCNDLPSYEIQALYAAPRLPQPAVPDYDALRLAFEATERKSEYGFNLHKYGIGYADEATQLRWEQWVACHAAMLQGAEPVTKAYTLPMQPLVIDVHGTLRFKENQIVRRLLDYSTERGYGLNEIARDQFDAEDHMQLAQLIGYSLTGYGELSYVTDESYNRAAAAAPQQEAE